jgi:DedD protein
MVESRVKERLTGAVLLVALIVLLVPELLSGPGKNAQPTRVTDKDGAPMRSYTIDLAENGGAPRAGPAESSGTPELQPMPAEEDPAGSEASEAAQAQPDSSAVASTDEERSASAVESPAAEHQAEPAPAAAASPPPAEPASRTGSAAPPVTGWMIQVGSFASRDNAERLARDLGAKGFVAAVSESRGGGRSLYRVRVGPEADRAAAQALLARLRSRGVTGAALVPHP